MMQNNSLMKRALLPLTALCLPFLGNAQTPPAHVGAVMPPPVMAMHPATNLRLPGFGPPPFLRGINLDEAQQDKIFQILHASQPRQRELEKERFKAEQGLFALTRPGSWEDGKAKSLSEAIGRASAELALMQARIDAEITALLTPEQRRQLYQGPLPERR